MLSYRSGLWVHNKVHNWRSRDSSFAMKQYARWLVPMRTKANPMCLDGPGGGLIVDACKVDAKPSRAKVDCSLTTKDSDNGTEVFHLGGTEEEESDDVKTAVDTPVASRVATVNALDTTSSGISQTQMEMGPYRGKPPGAYVPGADWRIWLKLFENFLALRQVTEEANKRLIFLDEIGPTNYSILESLLPGKELEQVEYKELKQKMTERFKPKVLILSERFRLMKLSQKSGQTLSEFYADIQNAAKTCELEKVKDTRDCFVSMTFLSGLASDETRKRLMEQPEKGASDLLELAEAFERVGKGVQDVKHQGENRIQKVDQKVAPKGNWKSKREFNPKAQEYRNRAFGKSMRKDGKYRSLSRQRRDKGEKPRTFHERPPYCHICRREGHLTDRCKFNSKQKGTHKVNFEDDSRGSDKSIYMAKRTIPPPCKAHKEDPRDNANCSNRVRRTNVPPCRIKAVINHVPVSFELDTGSGMTIIGSQTWEMIGKPQYRPTRDEARAYSGVQLKFLGVVDIDVEYGGRSENLEVFILDRSAPSLWGRDAIKAFSMDLNTVYSGGVYKMETMPNSELVKRLDPILKENAEVFQKGLGRCTVAKATLKFKEEDPEPLFFRARSVPYAVRPLVDEVLDRMVSEGSLKPVDHTEWATPLVVVPKPGGKVRLCGDFKVTLNPVLDINQYPLPKPDDMFHQLNGGQKFSKIDLKDAYTQVELEEESKKYLVLNTQKGLFQYQRLPFGIASAPAIFQKIMEQTLAGIPGVLCYLDDVTITAPNDGEHLNRLEQVLRRMRNVGFRLSREKCAFMVERMEFLGHIVDKEGIRPSPEKVKAMLEMPTPKNLKQVESFLGMVNYYGKFIPNLSTAAAPMNALRRIDEEFVWNKEHDDAFETIKKRLAAADVLAHYDPATPVVLATDASEYGIGAVIYHKFPDGQEKVIAYASRSLTKAEKNYAQIEKEGLGIVYGVEKFSQFLYGRKFTLLTDHQPLVRIFGPKHELPVIAAKRLHRWALRLMMYVFDIEYRRTEEFGNADGLSRLPRLDEIPSVLLIKEEDEVTRWAREKLQSFPFTFSELVKETENDRILGKLKEMIRKGFPEDIHNAELRTYTEKRDFLSEEDGIILWRDRVVIPAKLQSQVLKILHANHYGIMRMKTLARLRFWFPQLNQGIEKIAKACPVCAVLGNQLTKTPLHPWEVPENPWQRVHIDFCGPAQGSMWMVVVDAKTKWPEAVKMNNITARTTIQKLREIFTTHGVPEQIVSDNGPQLTSKEFDEFCKEMNIEHLLTSPYHPNSNGEAERFVQTFKKTMEKGTRGGGKLDQVVMGLLLQYRTTPHPATGMSPASMLMGRQLRMPLDVTIPKTREEEDLIQAQKYRERMVKNHDRVTREREFKVGEAIYMLNPRDVGDKWLSGIVTAVLGENRYTVHYGTGERQCHANQLKGKNIRWEDYEEWLVKKQIMVQKPAPDRKPKTPTKQTQILAPPPQVRTPKQAKHRPQTSVPVPERRSVRERRSPRRFANEHL